MRWALIGVFIAHNLEEILSASTQAPIDPALAARLGLDSELYRGDRFAVATMLLTVAVAVAVVPARRRRISARRAAVIVAAASALGLNGAMHLGRALATCSSNPGVYSSPAMTAAAALTIVAVCRASGLRRGSAVVAGAVGAFCSLPAIALSLGTARALVP